VKTPKERADERRQEKLAQIQQQIEEGSLTVRKMTAKERAAHPPRPRGAGRRRR
jgi:anti-sigma28 factor (negative regulator of flagellin synthesis)